MSVDYGSMDIISDTNIDKRNLGKVYFHFGNFRQPKRFPFEN
jgi:hypothetical protein